MKKFTIVLAALVCTIINVAAGPVGVQVAKQVGRTFAVANCNMPSSVKADDMRLVYTAKTIGNADAFYVFNLGESGFVIVAADDRVLPIYGYSTTGTFDEENIPVNMREWFGEYEREVQFAIESDLTSAEAAEQWETLASGQAIATRNTEVVDALLSTKWDQVFPYNYCCPHNASENTNCVTGCVATAMAQVMKFWNHPERGLGSNSYNCSGYGTLSANFGSTYYDWEHMTNGRPFTTTAKEAVGTLMYHCGVAVNMSYGTASQGGSGALVFNPYSSNSPSALRALKTNFRYQSSLSGKQKAAYTDVSWKSLIKGELNAGRPVIYSGGVHCFVCDGYDASNNFHFNWGWGGSMDGYFSLSNLAPGGGGAGGGDYNYTSNQEAIIGIQPNNVGVEENIPAAISVYPNPTSGILTIEGSDIQEFAIYDMMGKMVARKANPEAQNEINLTSLPSGVYIVKITTSEGVVNQKVVKE